MTTEEKAKAYDEALSLMKDCIPDEDGYVCVRPCDIFSVLKESEDERIRKWLEGLIEAMPGNSIEFKDVKRIDVLHWLERQGEPFDDNIITRDDEILQAISIGLIDAEKDLGWSDFGGIPIEEIQKWLEKQAPKPKWTEEDESKVKEIVYFLDTAKVHYASTTALDDCIEWLKSIKDRMKPQPKQEWSERDKEEFQIAIDTLVEAGQHVSANWLKSLKERYTWKPSDAPINCKNVTL